MPQYVDAPTRFRSQTIQLSSLRVPYLVSGANPDRKCAYFYVVTDAGQFTYYWLSTEFPRLLTSRNAGPLLPAVGDPFMVGNGYWLSTVSSLAQQRGVHKITHTQPLWLYMNSATAPAPADPNGTVELDYDVGIVFVEQSYV